VADASAEQDSQSFQQNVIKRWLSEGWTIWQVLPCSHRYADYQDQHFSKDLCAALVEGAATGAPGFIGVPFNLALSFLL